MMILLYVWSLIAQTCILPNIITHKPNIIMGSKWLRFCHNHQKHLIKSSEVLCQGTKQSLRSFGGWRMDPVPRVPVLMAAVNAKDECTMKRL